MKIKKFNESKSRQIEWLDGETFKLIELTGNRIATTKSNFANREEFGHLSLIELSNCYWVKNEKSKTSLDINYTLMHIDKSFSEMAKYKFVSDKYELILFYSPDRRDARDSSKNIIGVFDKKGKIIFIFDSADATFTLDDNLIILNFWETGAYNDKYNFLIFDLDEKKYVTFPKTPFLKANQIALDGEEKIKSQ